MAVALVTGAGSGIGRAAALRFSSHGCRVVVADVNDELGMETCHLLTERGGQATFIHVDVRNEVEVAAMVQQIRTQFGKLNFACNNAGIEGVRATIDKYPTSVYDDVMSVNCRGVWLCLKYENPLMLETGCDGAVAIMSSTVGMKGMPAFSAYCASKHALMGIAKSAALEYAGKVRVNCICPATTDTPMVARFAANWPEMQAEINASYPMGRIAKADEVADAVVWACMSATYMTGQAVVLDGGSLA